MWEEFVDGAISLGAAVTLGDALLTAEGEEELRGLFGIINPDVDGRVSLRTWGQATRWPSLPKLLLLLLLPLLKLKLKQKSLCSLLTDPCPLFPPPPDADRQP